MVEIIRNLNPNKRLNWNMLIIDMLFIAGFNVSGIVIMLKGVI